MPQPIYRNPPPATGNKPLGKKPGFTGDAADIAVDAASDKVRNKAVTLGFAAAAEGIARNLPIVTKTGSTYRHFAKRLPGLNTAIELGLAGREINERQKTGGFERQANEGDALRRKSIGYQAAKTVVSPAHTLSRIGASKEREDKKAFEAKIEREQGAAMRAFDSRRR